MATVLIVDDELNLVELVKGYQEREGFEVCVAQDGPSAVEKARAHFPDLFVLDIMLPGFDGVEACRQSWAASPAGPTHLYQYGTML
jgi:DNA-binding response OmpR family regulator